jgi:hypothetical protein
MRSLVSVVLSELGERSSEPEIVTQ